METDTIINHANQLGQLLSRHDRVKAFLSAQKALDGDASARELLSAYQRQVQEIQQLSDENKPIEVDEKRNLEQLQGQLVSNEVLKKLTAAQADYVQLMNQVNSAIESHLKGAQQEGEGGK